MNVGLTIEGIRSFTQHFLKSDLPNALECQLENQSVLLTDFGERYKTILALLQSFILFNFILFCPCFVCLLVCLFVCLFVCMCVCVYVGVCMCMWVYVCVFNFQGVYIPVAV